MELTFNTLKAEIVKMRSTREAPLRRWDYYRNEVTGPAYFPYLQDETAPEYAKRFRIAVNWPGAVANALATYFRKPQIEVVFDVGGEAENPLAKEAAEVWREISKTNDWDVFMIDVARDAGVGGNAYTKERIVFFDKLSGDELQTGSWKGQIKIDRVNELFMYRLWDGQRTIYVEAWARTMTGEYKLLSDVNEDELGLATTYIEVIAPPLFDEGNNGEEILPGTRAIWRNGALIFGPEEIPYKLPPLQRYANMVSRPESEDGISDIEAAIPLCSAINQTVSGTVRSIQYHGWPQVFVSGAEGPQSVQRGPERVLFIPSDDQGNKAEVGILAWDQNVEGARNLVRDLADMIASISGVPKHQLHDLDGAGAVVSGVALRVMYKKLNEVCIVKEAGFKRPEQQAILTALDMLAVHNAKPGYFDEVNVTVNYNPDRTPRDQAEQLNEDRTLEDLGLIKKVEMVMKYNPEIKTKDEAFQYLIEIEEEKAELRKIRVQQGNVPDFTPIEPGPDKKAQGVDGEEEPEAAGEGAGDEEDQKQGEEEDAGK